MALTKPELKRLIAREMLAFHPDCGWDPDGPLAPPKGATPQQQAQPLHAQPAPPTLPGDPPPPSGADAAVDSPMQFD